MLKITGGSLKGRQFFLGKKLPARPTSSKIREAIFNILTHRIELESYEVVDLFAGSGALGFEAISRGAFKAFFIDHDKYIINSLQKNIQRLSIHSKCQIFHRDAYQWFSHQRWKKTPKIFFLDPPYQTELANRILQKFVHFQKDLSDCMIVLETSLLESVHYPFCLRHFQRNKYNQTKIDFFTLEI